MKQNWKNDLKKRQNHKSISKSSENESLRSLKKIFCFEEIYTIGYRNRDGHILLDSDLLSFARIPYDDTFWYADPILPTQESTDVDYGVNLYLNDFSERDITSLPVLKKVTVDNILLPDVAQKEQIGVHSYALSERLEVVDMRYFHFSPRNRLRKIRARLG